MKSISLFIITIFLVCHWGNVWAIDMKFDIRLHNRLISEMNIIKKMITKGITCLKKPQSCSSEDQDAMKIGAKRIVSLLILLGAGSSILYAVSKKKSADQQIIFELSEAIRLSNKQDLAQLFMQYKLLRNQLEELLQLAVAFADAEIVVSILNQLKKEVRNKPILFRSKNNESLLNIAIRRIGGLVSDARKRDVNSIIYHLLKAGADPNDRLSNQDVTPFMLAAYFGLDDILSLFVDFGADKKLKDMFGKTAYEIYQENNPEINVPSFLKE